MTTSVQPCTTDITGFEFAKPCETGISDCQCEAVALSCSRMVTWTLEDNLKVIWL